MNRVCVIFGLFCLLVSIVFIVWNRRKTRRIMNGIERMLDLAMDGEFTEKTFDESALSALETRFAHYLSAAETSAKNVKKEKDKIKSLIADISHQTKTPIANLLLYSELLMEEEMSSASKENVEAVYHQSQKLHFLIDSLVKLSRLENGIITLAAEKNALQPMLLDIVEQYTAKAEKKGIKLYLNAAERNVDVRFIDTDICAVFDPKWTSEAIANVVDNAIKYTEEGEVSVSAVAYDMFVRIDISDTGIGIPESEQANIFSRFYRSQDVKEQEGVGIGLYLARQIVTEEGGYMKVSSRQGKGSVFSIFLPK